MKKDPRGSSTPNHDFEVVSNDPTDEVRSELKLTDLGRSGSAFNSQLSSSDFKI